MKIYRFMGIDEFRKLIREGATLTNNKKHSEERGIATTAVGFSFGIGDHDQARHDFRRLAGIVDPQYLIVCDKPDTQQFNPCKGRYVDWAKYYAQYHENPFDCPLGAEPTQMCDEYCTTQYSLCDIAHGFEAYEVLNALGELKTRRVI